MESVKNFSNSKLIRRIFVVLLGTVMLAISSKIKIPFYPVPMTMQTFVILLIGITYGYKVGLATVTLYLLEGIFGLPVFANSPEKGIGIVYFIGPTMGYLIGFLVAVYFAGLFKYDKGLINNFLKLTFSASFIYILGMIWLGSLIGWDKPIFKLGAEPFLLAELFKIIILALITKQIIKIRNII